jgi:hypothetical protein
MLSQLTSEALFLVRFSIPDFICAFRLVRQLQKADSYFIAIFAPDTVE